MCIRDSTPPYCGSTLLNQILSTSNNLSCNNPLGNREGMLLPEVRHIMLYNRWDNDSFYPWEKIKNILDNGCSRIRVGILPEGRIIAREGTKIFSLNDEEIENLSNECVRKTYEKDDYIIKQDDPGDSLFVIADGICGVYVNTPDVLL